MKQAIDFQFKFQDNQDDHHDWQLITAEGKANFAKIRPLSKDADGSRRPITVQCVHRKQDTKTPLWCVDLSATSKGRINLHPQQNRVKIKLIYFINCRVSQLYTPVLKRHLQELNQSGIGTDPNFQLIIVAAGSIKDAESIYSTIQETIPSILNQGDPNSLQCSIRERLEIRVAETSVYEFNGIHTYWKEAQCSNANDILIYCHCKGVSHLKEITQSLPFQSLAAAQLMMRNIYKNILILQTFPFLNKLGILQGGATGDNTGRRGWMFWNFYGCRARYVQQLPEPVISNNRFSYEFWLGKRTNQTDAQTDSRIGLEDGISLLSQPHPSIGFHIEGKNVGDYFGVNYHTMMASLREDQQHLDLYKTIITGG